MIGRTIRGERGQMSVELAMLTPVIIVVALAVYNLCRFCVLCAAFDRVSLDAVIAHGVSPAGEDEFGAVDEVRRHVCRAMDGGASCEVEVSAERVRRGGVGGISLLPSLTRYRCELRYRPWPSSLSIAGVSLGAPFALTHERSIVVDRYRAGVVR